MPDSHQNQQWLRLLQSSRIKTPPVPDPDETRVDTHGNTGLQTQRLRPTPRLSQFFNKRFSSSTLSGLGKQDDFDWMDIGSKEPIVKPDLEVMITSLHSQVMRCPHEPLPPQHNRSIMLIAEAFRETKEEQQHLRARLQEEIENRRRTEEELRKLERKWATEEVEYRAEIKRLEILIAQGRSGLPAVMQARQDSRLRRKNKASASILRAGSEEIVDDFTTNDGLRKGEQSSRRQRPVSPSRNMARLSIYLETTGNDEFMPLGTPPSGPVTNALENAVRQHVSGNDSAQSSYSRARNHRKLSDATSSNFSSVGDPLPDEVGENPIAQAAFDRNDLQTVHRMATLLARRKKLPVETILPQLLDIAFSRPSTPALPKDNWQEDTKQQTREVETPNASTMDPVRKHRRVFSFQLGDEDYFSQRAGDTPRAAIESQRRCASLSSINLDPAYSPQLPAYTPVLTPGTPPSSTDMRRTSTSLIPGPLGEYSRARPRREDSNSSFSSNVTAFRRSPIVLDRTMSEASSLKSTITALRDNSTPSSHPSSTAASSKRSSLNNSLVPVGQRLSGHLENYRGVNPATLAAKVAEAQASTKTQEKAVKGQKPGTSKGALSALDGSKENEKPQRNA